MLRRLLKGSVVTQSQQMARTLTCDSNCLAAKYGAVSSCQKWAQPAGSAAERVTHYPGSTFPTLDLCDRFPKAPLKTPPTVPPKTPPTVPPNVQEPRKPHNLLSQRRSVDPSRLQYVNERYQKLAGEVEQRQLNAKSIATRDGLHTARWKTKNK